ncbi:ATP-dependent DNA helicase DinG [Neisseriaceae bacterium PsAf]|nr:ATP-dependent DNA helicase DinG [Neisseriaceae bacterium PsAf]
MITDQEKAAIQQHYKNISQNFRNFKYRKSQQIMIAEIAKTLGNVVEDTQELNTDDIKQTKSGDSILVVEGPTGVGKSIAYLLSGSIMAQFRKKHLVISSATIALQQQLINKDLPAFEKASGLKISYTIAKGRSHYLCPYRLYQITSRTWQSSLAGFQNLPRTKEEASEYDIDLMKSIAQSFQERTFLGDREDWPEAIPNTVWNKINNDRHICLKHQCPNKSECPYFLIREEFEKTDIIVTNHDLLLSDLEFGGGVLLPSPQDSFYCIDEAHHLPKKAISHFSGTHKLSESWILFENLQILIIRLNNILETTQLAEKLEQNIEVIDSVWSQWAYFLKQIPTEKYQFNDENTIGTWILSEEDLTDDFRQMVKNTALVLSQVLKDLLEIQATLIKIEKDHSESFNRFLNEFSWVLSTTTNMEYVWNLMDKINTSQKIPLAKWIVCNEEGKLDFEFHVAPISAACRLKESIWSQCAGAILTSATLKSVNSFDLILSQTGLNQLPNVQTLTLDSPFDFEQQAELYLPEFINTPKQAHLHTQEIIAWFPKLVSLEHAIGTLVLFSSRKQMLDVYEHLPEIYRQHILVQGLMAKNQLLEQHTQQIKNNHASIIFGLDSFAEGMDLKGDLCVHVIIAKIPFSVPDNPIDKVYCDWLEKQGKNPFLEVYVPEASIKLAQAMGRLIRSETDYGRVTILDTRLLKSSYGKKLMSNFPKFKRI